MIALRWLAASTLALTSALAIAQGAPESLLPPGFDKPVNQPAPRPQASPRPSTGPKGPVAAPKPATAAAPAASRPVAAATPHSVTAAVPVIQPLPDSSVAGGTVQPENAGAPGAPVRKLTLDELARMTPDELEDALNLRPKTDMPAAARRSMRGVGILAWDEGGLPPASLGGQDAGLVRAILEHNSGQLVSRWGHILLRRVLVSRLDAPAGMNPADFVALRAALLVRMGEAGAARGVVQDVDTANFSPALSQAAFDAYVRAQDFTGMCPMLALGIGPDKAPQWQAASAICQAFRGDGNAGLAQLDRLLGRGALPKIDVLLAQKYAGAAGKARRAVTIEWDDVQDLTPWGYGLALAVGVAPPPALVKSGGAELAAMGATSPALGLPDRAAAADRAGASGILSSAALVDLYAQIFADDTISGDMADRATTLRDAYAAADAAARVSAIRKLWDGTDGDTRYARQVLTAYAAARLPVDEALADKSGDLIASMLAAGLDTSAARWASLAPSGSEAWALIALASPTRPAPVAAEALTDFHGNDSSQDARKSAFLLAGLAGLERITPATAGQVAGNLEVDLKRQTRWTRMIDRAADVNNPTLVALLAAVGMQGESWAKMTPLHLMHIVGALHRVGLDAEARMIAAEAVARG